MRVPRTRLIALLALAAACSDEKRSPLATAPQNVAPDAVSAYVAVSNSTPSVGGPVIVSVRARRGSAVRPIGSFTVRLTYDSTQLQFKEAARASNGMVMANAVTPGLVIAAGASSDGFADDVLVSAMFVANAPDALASLRLTVTELNSVQFEDQRARTSVARGLFRAAPSKH